MNKNGGWIKLHRKIRQNTLWTLEPFTKAQAWVDLLLISNQKHGLISVKNGLTIPIERGQCGHSLSSLARTWQWSRNKVKRFIKDLERENMVIQNTVANHSVITINNYCEYQDRPTNDTTNRPTNGATNDTTNGATNDTTNEATNESLTIIKEEKRKKGIIIEDRKKSAREKKLLDSQAQLIIEYLNEKTGKKFPFDDDGIRSVISERIADNYSVEDFKKVIDNKTADWLHKPKFERALRPSTLFGNKTKFIEYLNEGSSIVPERIGRQITAYDKNDDEHRAKTAAQNTLTINQGNKL